MAGKVRAPGIDDPLAKFYDEGEAPQAGEKNPVTGLREEHGTAGKQKLREEEGERKNSVTKRIIVQLMQDDLGREWLYDLLMSCNVFGTPFTHDPLLTAFNSGALHIGNQIKESLQRYAIKEYGLLLEEGWERGKLWEDVAADKK